jgi:predicted metal-dependent enzyme (double-stranded beta helix superfamily)
MTRYVAIDRLIGDLKGFARNGFPADDVKLYLAGTLIEPSALEPYLHRSETHYTRNLVHKDEDFEILVICWASGQSAPIHGHEGELCFARVERGTLRFSNYAVRSEEPVRLERLGDPIEGGVGFLDGPADIHAVDNAPDLGADAVSLHVYSRPYGECDIYESEEGPRRRVLLTYDTVDGKPTERSRA